jgi:hypothetical protein
VRVLEYRDEPGDHTHVHRHPDSVMVTLSAFRRRVASGGRNVDVELRAGEARWVGAQGHTGENVGETASHSIFIELKEPGARHRANCRRPTRSQRSVTIARKAIRRAEGGWLGSPAYDPQVRPSTLDRAHA